MSVVVIVIVFVCIVALVMPLFKLVCLFGVSYALQRIQVTKIDIKSLVHGFLSARAERSVFIKYLEVMTPSVIYPLSIDLAVRYVSPESNVYVRLQAADNSSMWWSLGYALFVTIGYGIYVYLMLNKNKATYTKEVRKGLSVINEVFGFEPNQDWFNKQAQNAIKALHSRYDKAHNVRHPQLLMMLAALSRDELLRDVLIDDVEKLIDAVYGLKKNCEDANQQQQMQDGIEMLETSINSDDWSHEGVKGFVDAIEAIESAMSDWFYKLEHKKRNEVAYTWKNYQKHIESLQNFSNSPWMECQYKQVMLIKGEGGMGKSHLIGNIVDERIAANEPTLLFLGASISEEHDPWLQILGKLDIKSKKETFFSGLDNYAIAVGKRVQIVIDAINESKGGVQYWADHMDEFLQSVADYPNIGIVLSLRTSSHRNKLDAFVNDTTHATYNVTGFTYNLATACEYMFESYGLAMPSWPMADGLFKNPMWLHMYCVSHEAIPRTVTRENHWEIAEKYIAGFDILFAQKYEYSSDRHLLQKVLYAIADRMIANKKVYLLPYEEALEAVRSCIGDEISASDYLKDLLQLGLLIQEKYQSDAVVHFEYETFGNYVIAHRLVTNHTVDEWDAVSWSLSQALTEIVPIVTGEEYFVHLNGRAEQKEYVREFVDTLPNRSCITESGKALLEKIWEKKDDPWLLEIIVRCATNPQIPLNASRLYDLLYPMPMMERDAKWTVTITDLITAGSEIQEVATWTMNASRKSINALYDEVALLVGELLIWSLCSTSGKLRDTSTKALVNLLREKPKLLMLLIEKYHAVNDSYITERLWGVAFGCCTENKGKEMVEGVAEMAMRYVFAQRPVVEHILIRDYARLIVVYAQHLGSDKFNDTKQYLPPYNSYESIPHYSDDYIIKHYEDLYKNHADERVSGSAMSVLNSMAVEYSRRGVGGYGDFGRYTFQYALDEFPEDPNDLSNWAVHVIFDELGYKPEDVKYHDSQLTNYGTYNWERIGKKYQWLALYKVAAVLSDYHYGEAWEDELDDPCAIKLRNIDPSLLEADATKVAQLNGVSHKQPFYAYEEMEDAAWIQTPKNMPDVKKLVQQETNGTTWVTLYAYNEYTLRRKKMIEGVPNREFWCFVQSCMAKKEDGRKIVQLIDKQGLQGRSFGENREIYRMYAGEWFWSDTYKETVADAGYEYAPMRLSMQSYDEIMIRPTMLEYTHESVYDRSKLDSDSIQYPNTHIVEVLGLHQYDNRGLWINKRGDIVLFDNAVTGGKSALMIRKDALLEYLVQTNQVVIWPILIEKRLKHWIKSKGEGLPILQSGGYVYMDAKGKMKYKIRQYEKPLTQRQRWVKSKIMPIVSKSRLLLYEVGIKLHIVKLSEDEWMEYMMRRALKKKIAERVSNIEERK